NEYAFAVRDDERSQVQQLRTAIDAAIASRSDVPPVQLAALAAYEPLHTLPSAPALLQRTWPPPLRALIDQQVRDPLAERALRPSIPALTAIDDAVSVAVREQYEDMPYPRWAKTTPLGRPTNLDWYLRNQFPGAPIQSSASRGPLEILIAG